MDLESEINFKHININYSNLHSYKKKKKKKNSSLIYFKVIMCI